MKKKCPYFKDVCIEAECGIWDEGMKCCSMVSIALGNWSLRSMMTSRKHLRKQNPALAKVTSGLVKVGLVGASSILLAYSLQVYAETGSVFSFILMPMITASFWYWTVKSMFEEDAEKAKKTQT